jgi:hypothetical protein
MSNLKGDGGSVTTYRNLIISGNSFRYMDEDLDRESYGVGKIYKKLGKDKNKIGLLKSVHWRKAVLYHKW